MPRKLSVRIRDALVYITARINVHNVAMYAAVMYFIVLRKTGNVVARKIVQNTTTNA